MKKIVCLVLSALLAISVMPVFAADSAGLEAAITTAKSRIDIPAELSEFSSSVSAESGGITSYRLQWETAEGAETQKRIETTVDGFGNILLYNYSVFGNYYTDKASLPKLSESEVIAAAYSHLARLNPVLAPEFDQNGEILHGYDVNSTSATVRFKRYVNGLPFCGNYMDITLGKDTGELVQLTSSMTYAENIVSPDGIITPEQAAEKFKALSPMTAKYITKYGGADEDDAAVLAYEPKNSDEMIDAKTGEEFKQDVGGYQNAGAAYDTASGTFAAEAAAYGGGFTQSELVNMEQVEGLMSESEARAAVEAISELPLEGKEFSGCTFDYLGGSRKDDGTLTYIANLTYSLSEVRGDMNVREDTFVSIDAKSGELLDISTFNNTNNGAEKPTITEARALETAKAFAAKYAADEYAKADSDIEASDSAAPESDYYRDYWFNFYRMENGYEYQDNKLGITVDKVSGKIKQFSKDWNDDIEFESPDGMISADEAFSALSEQRGIEARYAIRTDESGAKSAQIVYALPIGKASIVSAKSGKLLDYNGTEYKEDEAAASADDISGHYAETAISELLENGVISLPEGETSFRPNDVITQSELLAFVAALEGEHYPITPYYERGLYKYAAARGIIKSGEAQDENLPCIREDGPKYIIRALGYEEIAQMTDIFAAGFSDSADITPGMEGYIALAKGFGIVGGNPDSTFAPKEPLIRADAAIMIYNYLTK